MNPQPPEHAKNSPKLYGLFLLILGGITLLCFTVLPLTDALSGADDIGWFSVKATMVGFAVFGAGLIIAVGGRRGYEFFNPEPGHSKFSVYAVSFVLVGAGFGVAIGVQKYMESLGYVFRW